MHGAGNYFHISAMMSENTLELLCSHLFMMKKICVISILATSSITVQRLAIIYFRNRLTSDLKFSEIFQHKTPTYMVNY
jgi:hypothetical protein